MQFQRIEHEAAVDNLNLWGESGTVRMATAGFRQKWAMRRESDVAVLLVYPDGSTTSPPELKYNCSSKNDR